MVQVASIHKKLFNLDCFLIEKHSRYLATLSREGVFDALVNIISNELFLLIQSERRQLLQYLLVNQGHLHKLTRRLLGHGLLIRRPHHWLLLLLGHAGIPTLRRVCLLLLRVSLTWVLHALLVVTSSTTSTTSVVSLVSASSTAIVRHLIIASLVHASLEATLELALTTWLLLLLHATNI